METVGGTGLHLIWLLCTCTWLSYANGSYSVFELSALIFAIIALPLFTYLCGFCICARFALSQWSRLNGIAFHVDTELVLQSRRVSFVGVGVINVFFLPLPPVVVDLRGRWSLVWMTSNETDIILGCGYRAGLNLLVAILALGPEVILMPKVVNIRLLRSLSLPSSSEVAAGK